MPEELSLKKGEQMPEMLPIKKEEKMPEKLSKKRLKIAWKAFEVASISQIAVLTGESLEARRGSVKSI